MLSASIGDSWTIEDAERNYHVQRWGEAYFFITDDGEVGVRPTAGSDLSTSLHTVVRRLREQGVQFPALIRFQDILHDRVIRLNESFRRSIERASYDNEYCGVYPIKVNQLREVVEEILDAGEKYRFGLECGSKAELIATLPFLGEYDVDLLVNGGKDYDMMGLIAAAQSLGRRVYPIVERYEEYGMFRHAAGEHGFKIGASDEAGAFGVRIRLSTSGAGLWSESGGANSKFGISLSELIRLVEELRTSQTQDRFHILHFHLGSQISDVESIRKAAREAARIYAWLRKEGVGIRAIDVGGGLGVNYEAGNPDATGYINYNIDHYTSTIIAALKEVMDEEGVPHPRIISESGRAVTAHHSVLVVEAVGVRGKDALRVDPADDAHPLVREIEHLHKECESVSPAPTVVKRAEAIRAEIIDLFRKGEISLEDKAGAERLFWAILRTISERDEADGDSFQREVVDHYLCNFSVFRSMVDYWAIGQRFPIMPIHRLNEKPTRKGILDDLTCDSDGRVSDFVSSEGEKHFLELHPLQPDAPYYLGFFLMGAYQDIMGDMHNLFGRVTEAHVYFDSTEPDNFYVENILPGSTIREQLELVQYHGHELERRMSALIQREVREGRLRASEGVRMLEQYRSMFGSYTYLDVRARYQGN